MKYLTLLLILVLATVALNAQTQPPDTDSDGYYNISTLDHLRYVAENSFWWKYKYELDNDINASDTKNWNSGLGWFPIGNDTTKFTGIFDGNGYKIDSLYINRPAQSYIGFFGYASGNHCQINNLGISNSIVTGIDCVGGLVGKNTASATITYSYAISTVTGSGNNVGGLVGENSSSATITYSYAVATVMGSNNVGGFVGENSSSTTITHSYSTGSVTGSGSRVGGLVGDNSSSSTVANSYSASIVIGTGDYVGGLLGYNYKGSVTNSYSRGSVTGSGSRVGGLVGYNNDSSIRNSYSTGSVAGVSGIGGLVGAKYYSIVTNSFWDTQTSGIDSSAGGTGQTTLDMKTKTTFTNASWDFTTTWGIDNLNNDGYPYLNAKAISVSHDISMSKGWNMISSYVEPTDNSIDVVFGNLSYLYLAKDEAGAIYLPSSSIDNIHTWDYAKGYLVYMTNTQTLTITGDELVPENTPLDIAKGWNMIGYLCNKSGAIATVLNTIYTNVYLVKDENGDITLPSLGIDNIQNFTPGEGYLVYMTAADILTYPQNSSLKPMAYEPTPKVKYLKAQINTANNASLVITTSLANDFEIGVYNVSDELVGSGIVNNGRACVSIFGDDEYNDALTGAKQNEILSLKAFNPSNSAYYNVSLSDIQSLISNDTYNALRYKTNTVLTAKASTEADMNLNTPILSVNPNPVSDFAELSVNTAITNQVTNANISLFDNTGKLVKTIYTGEFSMQNFTMQLDCTELSSGTYSVVLVYDGKQEVAKLIIQK